jgi:hypothetical protein
MMNTRIPFALVLAAAALAAGQSTVASGAAPSLREWDTARGAILRAVREPFRSIHIDYPFHGEAGVPFLRVNRVEPPKHFSGYAISW